MITANNIKFYPLNAVASFMGKYMLFIIVFLFSYMINISVSRGETGKTEKPVDLDVYYQKKKVFRDWDKTGSNISKEEKALISLLPEHLTGDYGDQPKKVFKRQESTETNLIKDLLQGSVVLRPQDSGKEISKSPATDDVMTGRVKIPEPKEKQKVAEREEKPMIYGSTFDKNCHWDKSDCGFSIGKEAEKYSKKFSPGREPIDTTNFPIDL